MRGPGRYLVLVVLILLGPFSGLSPAAQAADGKSTVSLRAGQHDGYTRLVFDWGTEIEYQARLNGRDLLLAFSRPARFDPARAEALMRRHVAVIRSAQGGLALVLTLREPHSVRHFGLPGRVVIDLKPAESAQLTALSVLDGNAARTRLQPPLPRRRPAGLSRGSKGPDFTTASQESSGRAVIGAAAGELARVEIESPGWGDGDPEAMPGTGSTFGESFSVLISWDSLPAAAAFRFGDDIWILFDKPLPPEAARLFEQASGRGGVRQLPSGNGSLLMIPSPPMVAPRLTRIGEGWRVDFRQRTALPQFAVSPSLMEDEADPMIRLALPEAGPAHWLVDPKSGEDLVVVPTRAPGEGVVLDRRLPQFALLQSQQGLVLRPFDRGLEVAVASYGVLVRHERGLLASSHADRRARDETSGGGLGGGQLFDLESWRGGEGVTFAEVKQRLFHDLKAATEPEKPAARLLLARFYFAWGLTAEASQLLDALAGEAPALAEAPEHHLMRAVSALLAGDQLAAARLLSDPRLTTQDEVLLWQSAYAAATQDWPAAAAGFAVSDELIPNYAPALAKQLLLWSAEARLGIGDSGGASQYLVALGSHQLTAGEAAQADLLKAQRAFLDGDRSGARALWGQLVRSRHAASRVRARLALIELDFAEDRIASGAAIEALEQLRFDWRGDDFELALLLRLAELYSSTHAYRPALERLRQAATLYPERARGQQVAGRMRALFEDALLNEDSNGPSALESLALYEAFEELTPGAAAGDRILRRLAERSIELDLLPEAAGLLEDLLRYRLSGEARAEAGGRLAEVYLRDGKPGEALRALDDSGAKEMPPQLARARHLLRARALAKNDQRDKALALLADNRDPEAKALKAELHGQRNDWAAAQAALTELLPALPIQPGLAPRQSKRILDHAVASTLAGDEVALARLQWNYGHAMAGTAESGSFDMLTGGLEADGREDLQKNLPVSKTRLRKTAGTLRGEGA